MRLSDHELLSLSIAHQRGTLAENLAMALDHERLDVYKRALEFLDSMDRLRAQLPAGCSNLQDQLDRASMSIVLNIAEGAGEYSPADKHRFYRIARRSATESGAILDIVSRRRIAPEEMTRTGKQALTDIVSMLVRLIQAPIGPGKGKGKGKGKEQAA
jgi:four helix bundle protein